MLENNTAQNLNLNTDDTIIETTDVMTDDRNMQLPVNFMLESCNAIGRVCHQGYGMGNRSWYR
jgi:hypothetical protein